MEIRDLFRSRLLIISPRSIWHYFPHGLNLDFEPTFAQHRCDCLCNFLRRAVTCGICD